MLEAKDNKHKVAAGSMQINEKFLFPFEKLEVWQMSVDLAEKVLDLLERLSQASSEAVLTPATVFGRRIAQW